MDNLTADKSRKIAKFMGAVVIAEYKGEAGGYFNSVLFDFGKDSPDNYSRYYSDLSMRYHKDWSWLMPVIQKCFEKIKPVGFSILFNQLSLACFSVEMNVTEAFDLVGDIIHFYLEKDLQI